MAEKVTLVKGDDKVTTSDPSEVVRLRFNGYRTPEVAKAVARSEKSASTSDKS